MTRPLGINKTIFCDTSTSYLISICIWSADYFLSYVHPKGNHPWLSKNVGVCLGKRPYAWEQNRAIFWEPSRPIPKMLQVESLQPPGHDIGHLFNNLSNEWPSNLPFTENVVALQIIHQAWRMLWDYLVGCTHQVISTIWQRPHSHLLLRILVRENVFR